MTIFDKPEIKVIINASGSPNTYKTTMADGSVVYNGLFYDVYVKIKKALSDKYTFKEFYDEEFKVTKALNDIRDGKYDMGIHNFSTTIKRLADVDFTRSIILERDVIVYKQDSQSNLKNIGSLFLDVFLIPFVVIIIIGFIVGALLYKYQPNRRPDIPRKNWFRRAVIATIATFLGEAGMMAEESPLGTFAILTTILIMALSLAFNSYLTASVTNRVLEIKESSKYNLQTIQSMHIMALKGQSIGANFKRYGARVTEMSTTVKKMIKKYLENPQAYDGVALEMSVALVAAKKYNLEITKTNFGFGDAVFALNKKKRELLQDVNTEIKRLQESLETERICKKHIDPEHSYLCVL